MNAFFAMARAGQGGIGTVAGGIAEALVNTAVGLFVALPAVWGFNYFLGRVERFSVEMTTTGSELVDYFIKRFGNLTWKSAAADR
jgi:biopolymer transport protein ExbB/TolQ